MDEQTKVTKDWLDRRYRKEKDGRYYAHQPIYGYEGGYSEPNVILRLARTFHLIKILESLKPFKSVLDVGAGEGYLSALIRDLFGCQVHTSDLSQEACIHANGLFNISAAASDVTRLPFEDNSYDLVICSEVIEHLTKPIFAMSELLRVASKYVVITTAEFCPLGEWERRLRLGTLDFSYPHAEKNWFTQAALHTILGESTVFFSQMCNFHGEIFHFFENQRLSREQIEKVLDLLTSSGTLDPDHEGVIAVVRLEETATNHNVTDQINLSVSRKNQILDNILKPRLNPGSAKELDAQVDPALVEKLACLVCSSPLEVQMAELVCKGCRQVYKLRSGVPLMFLDSPPEGFVEAQAAHAIAHLSNGNETRRRKIQTVIAKYHHTQTLSWGKNKRMLAGQSLRLFWFARRNESLRDKFKRINHKINRRPSIDYLTLQSALTE